MGRESQLQIRVSFEEKLAFTSVAPKGEVSTWLRMLGLREVARLKAKKATPR
jgi:hypothetical protein